MQNKAVALVTGANKGIGLEIARALASEGFTVLAGSRNLERGRAAIEGVGRDIQAIELDVTDETSVAGAADFIGTTFGRLDVLVNNAGISHAGGPGTPFDDILKSGKISLASRADVRAMFDTNVFGVIAVTQAMLPLLRKAPAARIVNISSGAGSLGNQSKADPAGRKKFGIYSASKAALNAVTIGLSIDLEETGIKVNAVCPGFTATDLNNFEGTQTAEEAARYPVRMALIGPDGPTGTFSNKNGELAW